MRIRILFIAFLALLLAGGLLVFMFGSKPAVPALETPAAMSNEDTALYWEHQVRMHGGTVAYRSFVAWAQTVGINRQHTLAHIMGDVLYRTLGVEGLSVCDSSFSFGCFHEFLGRAIHEGGLPIVQNLNEACVEHLGPQSLSCQHGIGHGIQTYLGYDDEALYESLAECRDLPYSDPVGGCYGGVFMEYNMRTMLSLDGIGPREHESLAHPCSELSSEYLPACYYWQPQWWVAVRTGTMEDAYRGMGELCRAAGSPELVRKCFEGVGNISGQAASYNPTRTIELCELAAAGDAIYALYCRADAANSYFASETARDEAVQVCRGLSEDAYEYCRQHSDNTLNQAVVVPALE
jgi:hypothetical protein